MAKIYVTGGDDEEEAIDVIAWLGVGRQEEMLVLVGDDDNLCRLANGCETYQLYKADLPKLKRAVEKAIELGWHKM